MQALPLEQLNLSFEGKRQPLLSVDEIFADCSQTILERCKEDRRIERKPAGYSPRDLSVYLSMWANTPIDGGIIVIGMADNGQFEGCSGLSQTQLNELEKTGVVYCPDARFSTKRISVIRKNGTQDFVLVFRVYYRQEKVVETTAGEAYVRNGDSKKKLTQEEIRELQIDKGQVSFENEPCGLNYPDDFDLDLVKKFSDAVRAKDGISQKKKDTEILSYRHLGRIVDGEFIPNNACALLFSKIPQAHFPGCKVRFLRFEGDHEGTGQKFNPIKDKFVEGNVPTLIVETGLLVGSQLREFTRMGKDGKFYTAAEYPEEAWYEAIVNACCHRSYGLRSMNVFVKMFDDKLVVESPGGFPPLVTPKNIYECQHPRNPHLMAAMIYLDFVKCANEGTRRMRDSMIVHSLPAPEFEQKDHNAPAVRVTLRNNIKQRKAWVDSDASDWVGEALFKTLEQDEIRAINFVAEHERINVSQIQRLTQRSWPSAKRLLDKLVRKGIFTHHHRPKMERDPQAYYTLSEQGAENKVKKKKKVLRLSN